MSYTLIGIPGSPFVRKVQVLLLEKGLAYEDEVINAFPVPDSFAKINPMKRVPVLKVKHEGRFVHLSDSSAIALYLEREHPEIPFYPSNNLAFARALMSEEYADTVLAPAIGFGVFKPLVVNQLLGKPVDKERIQQTLAVKLPPIYDTLEDWLGEDDFFFGTLSIVDVSIATHFVNLHHAGQGVDADRWPHLAAHVERMHSRPSFAQCISFEKTRLPPPVAL